jgi:hypothetical protein
MTGSQFALGSGDVTVDESGRVIVNNPDIAGRIRAATSPLKPVKTLEPTNGNCTKCTSNTASGCGAFTDLAAG